MKGKVAQVAASVASMANVVLMVVLAGWLPYLRGAELRWMGIWLALLALSAACTRALDHIDS